MVLRFMRRVLGSETMSDVAADFPAQFDLVRVILAKWLKALLREEMPLDENAYVPGVPQDETCVWLAAQLVNFLFGDPVAMPEGIVHPEGMPARLEEEWNIAGLAGNLMGLEQSAWLREVVVQTLRVRLALLTYYQEEAARADGTLGRIKALLMLHGAEFPNHPSPREYRELVYRLVSWADSPQFPG